MTDRRIPLLETALGELRRDHQRLRSRCRKLAARLRRIEEALALRSPAPGPPSGPSDDQRDP